MAKVSYTFRDLAGIAKYCYEQAEHFRMIAGAKNPPLPVFTQSAYLSRASVWEQVAGIIINTTLDPNLHEEVDMIMSVHREEQNNGR